MSSENKNEFQSKRNCTIGALKANLISLGLFIPFAILLSYAFWSIWESTLGDDQIFAFITSHSFLTFSVLLIGILIHELIHGVTFAYFTDNGFQSVDFGVKWKVLTPYCHCQVPVTCRQYIIALLMPGIVLGIFPLLIGFLTGTNGIFAFGLIFTIAAGGDFLIAWLLRGVSSEQPVEDHPSEVGCIVYENTA